MLNDSTIEALLDRRVQARLSTDRDYLFAEDAEQQASAERKIELQEELALLLSFSCAEAQTRAEEVRVQLSEHLAEMKLNLTEVDFTVRDEGTIVLLSPCNDAARSWIDEHLYGDGGTPVQWFGGAVAIDHGMAPAILNGIQNDGLDIGRE